MWQTSLEVPGVRGRTSASCCPLANDQTAPPPFGCCLYLYVSRSNVSVFVCIRLYFDYMCLYLFVFVYICWYLYVSDHCVSVQHGLMPLTTADYRHFPFTHNADRKQWNGAVTSRTESFHNAVGNLRCFDATQSKDDKKPHFNWWDRDNTFIAGVKRAPPYTALFWEMFFKVAANLGDASKNILEANSPEAIDALRAKKVKVVTHDGSDFHHPGNQIDQR